MLIALTTTANGKYFEEYRPLSDQLILDYILHMKDFSNGQWRIKDKARHFINMVKNSALKDHRPDHPVFVPTMCTSFLGQLVKHFPQHKLILADFDFLPDAMPGENGPIIQGKTQSNKYISYNSYCEVDSGACDIFFPTNFAALKHLYCSITKRSVDCISVMKHAQFVKKYADLHKTATKSGFNPLVEDFNNMSFFCTK